MSAKRGHRTTIRQFKILLDFMEKHPKLVSGKLDRSFTARDRQKLWNEATELLNSDGIGSSKDSEKWRKTWSDWKANIKSKTVKMKSQNKISKEPSIDYTLTDIEQRLLNLIGCVAVHGDPDIQETEIQETEIITSQESFSSISACLTNDPPIEVDSSSQLIDPPCLSIDNPVTSSSSMLSCPRNNHGRKRKIHNKTIRESMAEILEKSEEKKVEVLTKIAADIEKIAEATKRRAEASERKSLAIERKATAAENKAQALHEIAIALRGSKV